MQKSLKKSDNLLFFLLMLGCMNIFGNGSWVFLILSICCIAGTNHVPKNDVGLAAAALLCASVFFSSLIYYSISESVKAVNFLLIYLLGYSGYLKTENKKDFIKKAAFAVFAGSLAFIILEYIYNAKTVFSSARMLNSVWTGQPVSVTLVALVSTVVIGFSLCSLFFISNRWIKCLSAVSMVLAIIINFRTATRTPFVLLAILLVLGFLLNSQNNTRKKIRTFIILFSAFLLAYILLKTDFLGIRDFVFSSELAKRLFFGEANSYSRFRLFEIHAKHMFDHPWGGGLIHREVGSFGHNWIQDGHDVYGIFATAAALVLTVNTLANLARIWVKQEKSEEEYLLFFVLATMITSMMVEPVFSAFPIYIWSMLFLLGISNAHIHQGRKAEDTSAKYIRPDGLGEEVSYDGASKNRI